MDNGFPYCRARSPDPALFEIRRSQTTEGRTDTRLRLGDLKLQRWRGTGPRPTVKRAVAVRTVARGPVPRDASSCLNQDLQDYRICRIIFFEFYDNGNAFGHGEGQVQAIPFSHSVVRERPLPNGSREDTPARENKPPSVVCACLQVWQHRAREVSPTGVCRDQEVSPTGKTLSYETPSN